MLAAAAKEYRVQHTAACGCCPCGELYSGFATSRHVLQGLRTRNAPKIKIKPFFGIPYGGLFGGCYGFVTAASEQHHGTALFEVLLCFILCTL